MFIKKISILVVSIFLSLQLVASYGTIEIAVMIKTPDYKGAEILINSIEGYDALNSIMAPKNRHLTLLYPVLELDEELIAKFPSLQKSVEKLPASKREEAYKKIIPKAVQHMLLPHMRRGFKKAIIPHKPIELHFAELKVLGNYLVTAFQIDPQQKILNVIQSLKKDLQGLFKNIRFDEPFIPHISLGKVDSDADINPLLIQKFSGISPLFIPGNSHIAVSARLRNQ